MRGRILILLMFLTGVLALNEAIAYLDASEPVALETCLILSVVGVGLFFLLRNVARSYRG